MFFTPWHFFLCPWHFSQKCPWHRKSARDNFGPKKVAVTFFWVPVTKIAKMCPWREILAVTNFDIKLKVPVTLKKVPVTFLLFFFSTNSYSLLIRYFSMYWLELYEGGVPYFWTAHIRLGFESMWDHFFTHFKSLLLLLRRHLHPRSLKCVGIFCIKWRQINRVLRIFRLQIRKSRPNLESESKYLHTLNPNLYVSWKTQISDLNPNICIHRIRIWKITRILPNPRGRGSTEEGI